MYTGTVQINPMLNNMHSTVNLTQYMYISKLIGPVTFLTMCYHIINDDDLIVNYEVHGEHQVTWHHRGHNILRGDLNIDIDKPSNVKSQRMLFKGDSEIIIIFFEFTFKLKININKNLLVNFTV